MNENLNDIIYFADRLAKALSDVQERTPQRAAADKAFVESAEAFRQHDRVDISSVTELREAARRLRDATTAIKRAGGRCKQWHQFLVTEIVKNHHLVR
jgi:hypothetical protein